MKFATELFPKGTFEGQQTDGAYIDETLSKNLDIYAHKIGDDMHFLGLISGHDSVGNGKSTILTQIGTYLTYRINQIHGTNNTFTTDNLAYKGEELADKSFKLPKYSVVCLDEGDDATAHGMKDLAVRLKRYFRKCRQLNQILLIILPSFFEFPKFYALNRSHFLIDVKFEGNFERGYFSFYGPESKKKLYLKGKKEWDYSVQRADFIGRFFSSYCFFPNLKEEIEKYRKIKYQDMLDDNENEPEVNLQSALANQKKEIVAKIYYGLKKKVTQQELGDCLSVSDRTILEWIKGYRQDFSKEKTPEAVE